MSQQYEAEIWGNNTRQQYEATIWDSNMRQQYESAIWGLELQVTTKWRKDSSDALWKENDSS